jgi:hypothetical protein
MTLEQWREAGHDEHSIVAEPQFRDPQGGDFTLREGSPAERIGFEPISMEGIGIYGNPQWVNLPKQFEHQPDDPLPPDPEPREFSDNFDTWRNMPQPVGGKPLHASIHQEDREGLIAVTDETAASGEQSLRVEDVAGLGKAYNPHFYYRPNYSEGTARSAFAIRTDERTSFYHEWRDRNYPYNVGPTLRINDGMLDAEGMEPVALPADEWVRVEVEAPLGERAGTWSLTLTMPDGTRHEFTDLPCGSVEWEELKWVGFVSTATGPAVFYLDDIEVSVE